MDLWALLIVFVFFMVVGAPVAFAIGLGALAYLIFADGITPTIVVVQMVESLTSLPLLALPFFVLAGELMNTAGITRRIFDFANLLVGHIRGGLAHVNILSSMFFAGISGSAVADAAGLGRIEIKAMRDADYDPAFSAAVTAASSCVGPIIPPSIMLVLYGTMADVSIGALFVGGMVPGIVLGLSMMAYVSWVARRQGLEVRPRARLGAVAKSFVRNVLALSTPFIILAAIISGAVTPTEAGVLAVFYALFVSIVHGDLKPRNLLGVLERSLLTTGQILFILSCSSVFGWLITTEQIPEALGAFFLAGGYGKVLFLLLMNLCLLFLGCFMSITSILIIVTPMLLHMALTLGIDLVHLGVVVVLNLTIGLITPPLGWCLYIVREIADVPFEHVVRAILPFLIPLGLSLLLITYLPGLITAPVSLFFSVP